MRTDAWPIGGAIAALVALVTVSWRATPDRRDVAVILYLVAGVLEAAGVTLTAVDVRHKRRIAQEYMQRRPLPPTSMRETIAEHSAAAHGTITYRQLERVGVPLLAALDGRVLAVAAGLLLLGIGVGTAANILSATA